MQKINEKTALRTHYCGSMTKEVVGKTVILCGWVHRRRDLGGLIFVDLRDREGLVQIVFHPEDQALFREAEKLRSEFVLLVEGKIVVRPAGTVNDKLHTGEVEVYVEKLQILNTSLGLPFTINEEGFVGEETRLKYRYLDLRRPKMFNNLYLRSQVAAAMREFLMNEGFIEVETPMMTRATPEGARDFLVPSRLYPNHFYALPQSPQLFKQLLMMSGFDRYFQIVRNMRDEDSRADRQIEFTQLDLEMSFIDENDVQRIIEGVMKYVFEKTLQIKLPQFPRITYAEAIRRFGCDKPDLRNPLELVDVADLLKAVDFKVFSGPANDPRGRIAVIRLPEGASLSRKQCDDYGEFVKIYGAKGLATMKVNDADVGISGVQSSILKFLPEEAVIAILKRVGATTGDLLFFAADTAKVVNESMAALRNKLANDFHLIKEEWKFLWVTDFPMFELTTEGWSSLHHPFTAPHVMDVDAIKKDPERTLSRAYDLVLNGVELGSGSIRINNLAMQKRVFELLGINEQEAEEKFGFLLEAMKYGCPPHGGMALGLDRVLMLMTGASSIRDVIAFPKTASAQCVLTNAPSEVTSEQLKELHLKE